MKFSPNDGSGSGSEASSSSVLGKRRRVGLVYDEHMCKHAEPVKCCKHAEPVKREDHPENPERIRSIWKKLLSAGIPQKCVVFNAKEVEDKYVAAVHTTNHIKLIKTISSKKPALQNKVASKYNSIYFNEGSSECACLAAGSVLEVAEKVAKGELNSAFAIVRPPGHHAEENEPMGFCLYNNVAIAARFLLNEKELGVNKILIVDWDVHHGNGTQKMFWKDSQVLFFSVHRHDNREFYPFSDDASHIMMGEGPGLGYNINVPWESGQRGDADYFAVWDHILVPVAKEFNPDIVIISAGFDAAVGDPIGECLVTPHGYSIMLKKLMEFSRGKIIMALEGGYNLNSMANSALACVQVLLEDKPIVDSISVEPFESTWRVIKAVREQLSAFWPTILNQVAENQNLTIAHGKAADNDENTLLETSKEGNEEEDEFMDVDIEIISASENLPFTSSLPAHCQAANNDEDTLLETSAKGNEEEEEECIDDYIQINTTSENLLLTSSPTANSKAANNDKDTLLETSAEGNDAKEEFIDEDIQINPTFVSHPFTSSQLAHYEAVNNDEDTLLETSALGNEEEEEEEEEFIKEDTRINPTFENLSLASSPPTHCKAAKKKKMTPKPVVDMNLQSFETQPNIVEPDVVAEEEEKGEVLVLSRKVRRVEEKRAVSEVEKVVDATSDSVAKMGSDPFDPDLVSTEDVTAPPSPLCPPSLINKDFAEPVGWDRFLKVPISGYIDNGASVFILQWDFKEDNLATDYRSLREYMCNVIPPSIRNEIKKLRGHEARCARAQMSFLNFALACDDLERDETDEGLLKTASRAANDNEAEMKAWRGKAQKLEEELRLANEARVKAESNLNAMQLARERAEAAVVPLQEQVVTLEYDKTSLVEIDQRLQDQFKELQDDLATASKEISKQGTAWDKLNKDYKTLEKYNKELERDLERLQAGIPDILKAAMGSQYVTEPFLELLRAVQEVEFLEAVDLFSAHVPYLPDPLPEPITAKINPDCHGRAARAVEALEQLVIPFVEEIGSNTNLSVDDILNMKS